MGVDSHDPQPEAADLREQLRVAETLRRIGGLLAAERDLERLVQLITEQATQLAEAEYGALFLRGEDAAPEDPWELYALSGAPRAKFAGFPKPRPTPLLGETFLHGRVLRVADVTRDPRFGRGGPGRVMPAGHPPVRSLLAVPLQPRSGRLLGALLFAHRRPNQFAPRHERLVRGVAAQAAAALENARLHRQMRRAARRFQRLYESLEQERRLLAYDLHDTVAQSAAGALMHLEAYAASLPEGPRHQELQTALDLVRKTIRQTRQVIAGIRPPLLDELGVAAALNELAAEYGARGLEVEVRTPADAGRLPAPLEIAVYRIAEEALANTIKHSGSRRAVLELEKTDRVVRFRARDWGAGLPEPSAESNTREAGDGLAGIRDRAELLGGRARLLSRPGRGVEILVELPLTPPPPPDAARGAWMLE